MNKIKRILNLSVDDNQKWILIFSFITCLILSFTAPIIHQTLYVLLPTRWFAFSSLIGSISGLFVGIIWKGNIRKFAINKFLIITISECLICFGVGIYMAFFGGNIWVYAITQLIYVNLISRFVYKAQMYFKSKLWNGKKRENYDNNESIILYLSMIFGYLLAIIYVPTFTFSMFLFGFCCLIDDTGWIIVFIKNKQSLNKEL